MNADLILILKKTMTLAVLVEPIVMTPAFLSVVSGLPKKDQYGYALRIGFSVATILLVSALIGKPLLSSLGISMPSMQIGGAVMMFILAIAMILGREAFVKGDAEPDGAPSIVPLAVPLLVGPASISYVVNNSIFLSVSSAIESVIPIVAVGVYCAVFYSVSIRTERIVRKSTLDLIEKIGGMLLLSMSIELGADGILHLFQKTFS